MQYPSLTEGQVRAMIYNAIKDERERIEQKLTLMIVNMPHDKDVNHSILTDVRHAIHYDEQGE